MSTSCLRRHSPLLLFVGVAVAFDVEGGRPPAFPRTNQPSALGAVPQQPGPVAGPPGLAQQPNIARSAVQGVTKMARRYQAFIAATAKVSRGISMACGLWLIVGTPLVLIKSGVTLRAGDAILSIYLATFGLLMFLVEVPLGQLQKFLQAYLYFMFTRWGRAYFLMLTATTAWTLAKVGAFTKVLLFFSAGLSTYVMFSSNRFGDTDGKASELANQIGNEVLGRAKKAWSIGEMFGISKAFSGGSPAPQSAGGFSQPEGDPTAGAWPTGGGDGA